MAFLAKFAASKYVGDRLEENFGPENPKYDILISPSGKRTKTRKPLPPNLTPNDARILKSLRAKAWRYEWWVDCHCCCGLHVQFGTVTLWGLLPVVGDIVSLLNALSLVRLARRVDGGLPPFLVATMLVWCAVDFALKLVPVVGDVLTAIVKPNTRNLVHVEGFLARRGERRGVLVQRAAGQARDDGLVREGGGAGVREPLLVGVQPAGQPRMAVGGQRVGGGVAEPAYGTVLGDDGAGEDVERGQARKRTRHILPFWRRNEDSDVEEEV